MFIKLDRINISFAGKIISDSVIHGTFNQGVSIPLVLEKVTAVSQIIRPQTPQPPFPYISEDVTYENTNRTITFGATITYPSVPPEVNYIKAPTYPVIILINGSGPQNRDGELFNHKPFAVIADHFTRLGYMVMRIDDRETGKTTGRMDSATSADFVQDIITAIEFIKKQIHADTSNITLIGHSEGGMIAPAVANKTKVHSLILLAAPGLKIPQLMAEQNAAVLRSVNVKEKTVVEYTNFYKELLVSLARHKDTLAMKKNATAILNNWIRDKDTAMLKEIQIDDPEKQASFISSIVRTISKPWFHYFLNYDAEKELRKLKNVHVLAMNGERDIQVISSSNLEGIRKNLKKSKVSGFKIVALAGLNHLFQKCVKCTVYEYGELDETFSTDALKKMSDWLQQVNTQK